MYMYKCVITNLEADEADEAANLSNLTYCCLTHRQNNHCHQFHPLDYWL